MIADGIGLKLLTSGEYSPLDIANIHIAHARTHSGEVLYSTDIPISARYHKLKSAILYFEKAPGQYVFIHADVLKISYGDKLDYIPKSAAHLSPEQYANQPKRTWLHLKNLRRADTEFLHSLKAVRTDGTVVPFTHIVSDSARANRVYWYIDAGNDDGLNF